MDLSRQSPTPARYVGIGLVAAVHLAAIYALSMGLVKTPPQVREPATVKALPPDAPEPPQPIERVKPTEPVLRNPEPILVQPPIIEIFTPPSDTTITTTAMQGDLAPTPSGPTASTGPAPTAPPVKKTETYSTPGAVCSVMPRPEVPAVSWSGEAVLQVLATVRGGRVVGSEFRVAQGAVDGKTRRSLQRAVESALAGYQCQGDAVFQQDFAFRLD